MYWVTTAGFAGRCGNSDPGTAATASSSSRNSAVRMLVSCVHAQRSMPTGPSEGRTASALAADTAGPAGPLPASDVPGGRGFLLYVHSLAH